MNKIITSLVFLISSLFANDLEVKNAFIKQTPPHAPSSAIFLTLYNNTDKDIALIDAKTDISEVSELHTHIHKNGKMAMIQVPKIIIKAHSSTELKPGGYHIMLFKLSNPVTKNTKANLILKFDNNQTLKIKNINSKEL